MTPSQTHPAVVLAVHDGDTITVRVTLASTRLKDTDLGFHVYAEGRKLTLHIPVRLLGCNAIELNQPGGVEARDNLASLLPVGTPITLRTVATDKYARYDAAITLPDGTDLVPKLIADGWAAPWNGQGPKPVPAWPRTTK